MTWKFSVDWDPDQLLIMVRCQGLWTMQDTEDFEAGVLNLLDLYQIKRFDMMVDLGLGLTQTAEVAARLMAVDEQFMKRGLRRRAAYSQSAMVRAQVTRLISGKQESRIFPEEETARQWLLAMRRSGVAPVELAHP
ncbi:hypothetical protein [Sphingobium phenoxybenzoativorans]|uniref:hypothetical protein n=1 Tax=Sphingobium phenoxybenzoativorans TaxID=1592790 RepID=UPI000871D18B|nr:hypothetical protein [Sphingobium phenoxybenzoativorans]